MPRSQPSDGTDARSVLELVSAVTAGAKPKYLFFWGHTGPVERACFSQWYDAPFDDGGVRYATAEHWMMAEKARAFGDDEVRARILAAGTPGEAKKLGREVRDFDEAKWERERFGVVVRGNELKFGQNDDLGHILRASVGRVLVEASPNDRVWGIGMVASDELAASPRDWRGLNVLGFALMEARARLMGSGVSAR